MKVSWNSLELYARLTGSQFMMFSWEWGPSTWRHWAKPGYQSHPVPELPGTRHAAIRLALRLASGAFWCRLKFEMIFDMIFVYIFDVESFDGPRCTLLHTNGDVSNRFELTTMRLQWLQWAQAWMIINSNAKSCRPRQMAVTLPVENN